jgi:diguanylate cyclase (GGDEF)-like protein/PAS domain S-box-containing protein
MVMALSVAATGVAWFVASDGVTDRARARFDETAQQADSAIVGRMKNYEQILVGGQGLFAASHSVGREAWREYVRSLDLDQRFPGIQAMAFSRVLPHREKARYIENIRREGFSTFDIFPSGDRDVYAVVTYPEPFVGRNRMALGYDMFSEPVRREAMERARDTGEPTVSGRLRLLSEPADDHQYGFVFLVPVYANGQPHTTVAERQAALVGFTVGVFRVTDLMSGVLGGTARDIRFEIFDGDTTARDRLLYGDVLDGNPLPYRPTFQKTTSSEIGGRTWTFALSTWPNFDAGIYYHEPVMVLIGGLVVSLLLFGITWSLTTTRERALALAELMTDALRAAQAQFRAVTDHANDAMVSADGQGTIIMWNRSAGNVFGYSEEDVLGQPLTVLLAERSRPAHEKTLQWVADNGERSVVGQTVELVGQRKGGGKFPLELSLSTWTQGEQRFYTGIMRDITERKRTTERLGYLATHDALTGLPNRTLFADRLDQALARSAWNQRLVAVMFLDLDRFKTINDTLGHDAGDLLIQTVATRLTGAVREGDTVARQGGDEFTIVLIDMAQTDDVALVAQKILNAMVQPFNLNGHQTPVTFSIGIACYPVDGTDAQTLLKHADTALYQAKARGRNTYQLYSPDIPAKSL